MIGIKRYGVYVPGYRLTRAMLREAWETGSPKGERALANHDEDTVTMAVEAVENCLAGGDHSAAGALFFASASPPYIEKSAAATVAAAADLGEENFRTADFGASLCAGMSAFRSACDALDAAPSREAVVVASEMRVAEPGTPHEGIFGDAAAALWLAKDDAGAIAEVNDFYSISADFTDIWRRPGDPFVNVEDAKFVLEEGYGLFLKKALDGLLNRAGIGAADISKAVFYAPDAAGFKYQKKTLGLSAEQLSADSQLDTIGNTGNAMPFLLLAAALDESSPGDRIAVLGYGNGAQAVLLTVTDAIKDYSDTRGLAAHLAARRELSSYQKYLRFRGLISMETVKPFAPMPLIWRERKAVAARYGSRCNACGAFVFPPRRVCRNCDAKDDFTLKKLGRAGRVYTFAKDHLVPSPDLPVVMMSADMDGGGRLYAQYTDADASTAEVGMNVELCFRRINEGGDHYNYFWKFRPPLV